MEIQKVFRNLQNNKIELFDLNLINYTLDQANLNNNVYINNCLKSLIIIPNKITNLLIENSKDSIFIINTTISKLELIRTKDCVIICKELPKTIQQDYTENIKINSNEKNNIDTSFFTVSCINSKLILNSDNINISSSPFLEQHITNVVINNNKISINILKNPVNFSNFF